jgi:hypothetical protein
MNLIAAAGANKGKTAAGIAGEAFLSAACVFCSQLS